jgi:hypothetical protein
MSKKIENWKANANVVWLVAAVVGLFTLNALRVALRPNVWTDNYSRGKSRAAADILHLHNTIAGLEPKLESMPHRYALFRMSKALENACILEDALLERLRVLDEVHREGRRFTHGVQLNDIPEIVAGIRAQLAQTVEYIKRGCFGNGPAISSDGWFDYNLISRYSDADRAKLVVAPVTLVDRSDDSQKPGGDNANRVAPVGPPEAKFDERRVSGDDGVLGAGESPPKGKLYLLQGGRA